MTNKRKAFVTEYLKDRNATRAAMRAGYKVKNAESVACRLVKNSQVAEEIRVQSQKIAAKCEITVIKVLTDLERVRGKSEKARNFAAALKASELEGKHLQMFTDVIKTDQVINVSIKQH